MQSETNDLFRKLSPASKALVYDAVFLIKRRVDQIKLEINLLLKGYTCHELQLQIDEVQWYCNAINKFTKYGFTFISVGEYAYWVEYLTRMRAATALMLLERGEQVDIQKFVCAGTYNPLNIFAKAEKTE